MRTLYAPLFFGALLASNSFGQSIWSANVATGVPNFPVTGIVKTTTVDTTVHGRGVKPVNPPNGAGTSYLYIPVTAPNNSTFACIGLRAMDNTNAGLVRAEFWRQPRNAAPGPAVLLGQVSTVDVFVPVDGFQFQTSPFAAVIINYNLFTYYIRVMMTQQSISTAAPLPVTALDVSLSQYCQN